jgi:hypothetical protein
MCLLFQRVCDNASWFNDIVARLHSLKWSAAAWISTIHLRRTYVICARQNSNSIISFRILPTFEISSTVCFYNISSFLLLKISMRMLNLLWLMISAGTELQRLAFCAFIKLIQTLNWNSNTHNIISLMTEDFFEFSSRSIIKQDLFVQRKRVVSSERASSVGGPKT